MARKRRTSLPPITEQDRLDHPELLRDTPNGGKAWKCCYCKLYASRETQAGKYVCYAHVGVREFAHNHLEQMPIKEKGKTPPQSPRQHMTHSFYVGGKLINLDELVEAFEAHRLNPNTADDLPYLRAFLHELMDLRPSGDEGKDELQHVLDKALTKTPADASSTDQVAAHQLGERAQAVAPMLAPAENVEKKQIPTIFDQPYSFSFPEQKLPRRGLSPCPCGSGKPFFSCHSRDYTEAVRAGLCMIQ